MIKAHQAMFQSDVFPENTIDRLWSDGLFCLSSRGYRLPSDFCQSGFTSYLKTLGLRKRRLVSFRCRGLSHTGDKTVEAFLDSTEEALAVEKGFVKCPTCGYRCKWNQVEKASLGMSIYRSSVLWVSDIKKYSLDFVERIKELCQIFGIELSEEEVSLEQEKYLALALCGQIIPQLKYTTNFVFNRFWGELPPEGTRHQFLGVRLFPKRLAVRLNIMSGERGRRSYKNQILMNTLFQGFKRGLLPVDPTLIQKTLDKHRTCLQKDPTICEELSEEIRAKAAEILRGYKGPRSYGPSNKQSAASTTCSTFADGGNIGFVRDSLYPDELLRDIAPDEFVGYIGIEVSDLRGRRLRDVVEVYEKNPLFSSDIHEFFRHTIYKKPEGVAAHNSKERDDEHLPSLCAVPACILEPMKVRMITKPSTGLHVRMHTVQKSLWEYLYHHKSGAFKLIGEELNEEHLRVFVEQFADGEKFCSGDYSAATDNLKGQVTQAIVEVLNEKIYPHDPFLAENLRNSLTSMYIMQEDTKLPSFGEYSCFKDFVYKLENFHQSNGQLMGHVVSFVILCIANVIAYWRSIEAVYGKVSFKELNQRFPVLVNGDDILFKTKSQHYEVWLRQIREFGFDPSIGKNFFNDRFLQINSQLYRIDLDLGPGFEEYVSRLVKIPMINFGLITFRGKNDCSKDLTVQRIGAEIEENTLLGRLKTIVRTRDSLMSNLPNDIKVRADALFKKHSNPMLKHFGLLGLKNHLHADQVGEVISSIVKNEKIHESWRQERLTFYPEVQSVKLDRGELSFAFERVRSLHKVMFVKAKGIIEDNPFFLTGDVFETIRDQREKTELKRCRA